MTGQSYRFDRILDVVENSVLKQKILFSLANNPVGLKTSDLIKAVGSDTSNVRGAIKGNGKRYSKERSLEALGLATHKETTDKGRKVNVYKITDEGKKVVSKLKKQEEKEKKSEQ